MAEVVLKAYFDYLVEKVGAIKNAKSIRIIT